MMKLDKTILLGSLTDSDFSYEKIPSIQMSRNTMKSYLTKFNEASKAPITLVLFDYTIFRIVRILRILTPPGGHDLLTGLGGSGRKSLYTDASFIAGYHLFRIETYKAYGLIEWRENSKQFLKEAEVGNKPYALWFN